MKTVGGALHTISITEADVCVTTGRERSGSDEGGSLEAVAVW